MAPKYQMVADTLRSDILDGVYQKRMLLPTEQLLCQQFQVSRQTVRQALSLLASEGLIERRQGSGSHIRDLSKPAPLPRRSIAVSVASVMCSGSEAPELNMILPLIDQVRLEKL